MFNIFIKKWIGVFSLLCFSQTAYIYATPQNFLYMGSQDLTQVEELIKRSDIHGVQIVYAWKALEKSKDEYDFSKIEQDLHYLHGLDKKLFIQIQDRFFTPEARHVPDYLLNDPIYQGGIVPQYDHPGENKPIGNGWVTQQWNPLVQIRFQKLLTALAKQFDGDIFGINLPETAIDLDTQRNNADFSCDKYFHATIENIGFAKKNFKKSYVVQYVNFWPCEWNNDHQYMSRLFAFAKRYQIGLGGPDIIPNKKEQMANAYPFFHQYQGKLSLVAMAVQEPTLTYTNPKTQKPFTYQEFVNYAKDYLGVNIIFWSTASPWLKKYHPNPIHTIHKKFSSSPPSK